MNYRCLSLEAMVNVSGFWLGDPDVRVVLDVHLLGQALLHQLRIAHELAEDLEQRKLRIEAEMTRLGVLLTVLDGSHDRFVRAGFFAMNALIEATDDPELRAWLLELRKRFFPKGLALVKAAYADEAGWARSVAAKLTADERARMATIALGTKTLDELIQSWLTAGIELGTTLLERAKVEAAGASTGPDSDELHASRVRSLWIRTVQAFVNGLDLMRISAADRAMILAPLHKSIALAQRGEHGADDDDDADVPADGDAPVEDDVPAEDLPAEEGTALEQPAELDG